MRRPVLIHVVTRKGRGYKDDVPEITCYHAASGSKVPASASVTEYPEQGGPSFTAAFADQAIAMAERDPRVVVITAAMLEGTGLVKFQQRFPERCLDVGMAEQHGVGLAAGMALAGYRPICAIYSTFLQRAYDQVFQEVALQRAPVLFCLDRGGLVGSDGATHNGVFDIAYLRCLPNFVLMSPRDTGELAQMMELGATHDGPTAIRFPRGSGARPGGAARARAVRASARRERVADGDDGAIVAYGPLVYAALELRRRIDDATGRVLSVDQRALRQAARRAVDRRGAGAPAGRVHARGPRRRRRLRLRRARAGARGSAIASTATASSCWRCPTASSTTASAPSNSPTPA